MEEKNNFRLQINLDHFKLELAGVDAQKSMGQIIKLLDKIQTFTEPFLGAETPLEEFLGEDIFQNKDASKLISNFSQIYRDYRMNRVSIENNQILELVAGRGKVETTIDDNTLRKEVKKLLFKIPKENVAQILLHIKGNITKEETNKIVDLVQQDFPNIDIKRIQTSSQIPTHTIVEGIFFGEFEQEFIE